MGIVKFSFNSYTMNQSALLMGCEAVKDDEYFKKTIKEIVATREKTKERLTALGFECTNSKANFLFATHQTRKAKDIFELLKSKDIFVRYFNLPRIDNYARITIGTEEEMDALIKALLQIL